MAKHPRPTNEELWQRLLRGSHVDDDGCRLWDGRLTKGPRGGYGVLSINDTSEMTHRTSFQIHHGPIPPGKQVLHRCDKRRCIEPACLWAGTCKDNMADMAVKGRAARGARQHLAKLTDQQVLAIARRRGEYRAASKIAREYGVTPANIAAIWTGRSWGWLTHIPDHVHPLPSGGT